MRGLAGVLLTVSTFSGFVVAGTVDIGTEEQRQAGKVLYDKYCSQCHGVDGDGKGVAAPYVKPRPRDFTRGKYKVRTTPTGALPTTQDLKRIIRVGMPYSTMPEWPQFSDSDLTALAYHLKTFYPGFANPDENRDPLEFPGAPSYSEESSARGREIYVNLGCARCHGELGRGDGPSAPTLADDWGYHIRPADLTKPWTFRGGPSREDIYRTVITALNGTPMPSYADENALAKEDRWALVDYVVSLSGNRGAEFATVVTAVAVSEAIDLQRGEELFAEVPKARFPVFGQIVEPGRNFYPAVTDVEVSAVYNQEHLAILVQWHDMSAETEGESEPSLEVPVFDPVAEEALEHREQAGGGESDDLWGADPFARESAPEPTDVGEVQIGATGFPDAVAVQLPLAPPSGNRKPYFIFGDSGNPVDLWFVDLASGRPRAYTARGAASMEAAPGESLESAHSYRDGRWSVVFRRKRNSARGISFRESQFVPISFSVWDGFNRERGNRRALTSWYNLYLEPMEKPSLVGPIVRNSLGVLFGLVLIVFLARRKYLSPEETEE